MYDPNAQRYTIPTHLSKQEKVLGPFTRRGVLLLLIGAGFAADLYYNLASLDTYGMVGLVIHLCITAVPLLGASTIALTTIAGRTLDVWMFIAFLYLRRPKYALWQSVCLYDPYALPEEEDGIVHAKPAESEDS